MKKENQRIAIAEACGIVGEFKYFTNGVSIIYADSKTVFSSAWVEIAKPKNLGAVIFEFGSIPDYLNDLNAIRPVVLDLIRLGNKSSEYVLWLWEITGLQKRYGFIQTLAPSVLISELFVLANPTAEQMCEAYLKTIGKWTDD